MANQRGQGWFPCGVRCPEHGSGRSRTASVTSSRTRLVRSGPRQNRHALLIPCGRSEADAVYSPEVEIDPEELQLVERAAGVTMRCAIGCTSSSATLLAGLPWRGWRASRQRLACRHLATRQAGHVGVSLSALTPRTRPDLGNCSLSSGVGTCP